jgi:molecular chaperone DnaJ
MSTNHYETLGLTETDKKLNPDEFKKELKKKYKTLCKEYHPDKGGDEEKFKEISQAYEILSDSDKKANYDRFGSSDGPNANHGFGGFNGFGGFGGFEGFGQNFNQKPERVGQNMSLLLKLTLEEIYNGVKKKFKYLRNDSCESCNGHGGTDIQECKVCNGSGQVERILQTPIGFMRQVHVCNNCHGTGETYVNECNTCHGAGVVSKEETIEIDVPIGVADGMSFTMPNKGHSIKSGKSGNLIVNVMELPHESYIRSGNDLKLNVKVSYPQLILGDKIDIETIDGGKIRITVPEYSEIGSNLRIQRKGMRQFNNNSFTGDMIVRLDVDIPKDIDNETKEILIKLKEKLSNK